MDDVNEKTSLLSETRKTYTMNGSPGSQPAERLFPRFLCDLSPLELAGAAQQQHCHGKVGETSRGEREKRRARLQLYVASAVCLVFMIGEVVGGYLAHSLAIMTDAAHLLTDFASMLLSLFSLWMASRPATKTMNFGWHRAEILGALVSVLSIWVVTGVLVYLAVQRILTEQYEIDGRVMLITSGCAVAVNVIMGITLHQSSHLHGHSHGHHGASHSHDTSASPQQNPSVRAAFIHVIGDLLQSVGVLIAAYVIYFKPEYKIIDPICTFLFSLLVLATTITILRDVLRVLMEGRSPLRQGSSTELRVSPETGLQHRAQSLPKRQGSSQSRVSPRDRAPAQSSESPLRQGSSTELRGWGQCDAVYRV
ncbi:zinc transporter 2-like [Polyodon spathula]|uniref:zinc transporter 2-like n=1 Tax=Polyodon spathula TaxID=7913 RepID=UPI001B7EBA8F|nr:zinc transporter 2-like [Polyodon spathula]